MKKMFGEHQVIEENVIMPSADTNTKYIPCHWDDISLSNVCMENIYISVQPLIAYMEFSSYLYQLYGRHTSGPKDRGSHLVRKEKNLSDFLEIISNADLKKKLIREFL